MEHTAVLSSSSAGIEVETILVWLQDQRAHAIGILDGLGDDDLRRPVLSSGWSCLGMISHLADLERFWFRRIISGESSPTSDLPYPTGDNWVVDASVPAAAVFAGYRREAERTGAIVRALPLDTPPAWWPDFFGDWRLADLRSILFHVLTETAGHAGHLDAARELIDGRLWLVID